MKHILLLIGFALLCLAGVAGIPSWPRSEKAVGYYKISTNPYGVAIYQDGKYASIQFVNARSFTVKGNTITIPSASAVSYSRDDILFDATTIYTEPTQEQIDYLNKKKIVTSQRIISLPQTIYLVNPHIPGMLEFRGSNMRIDLDQKQVEGTIITVIVHDKISI